MTILLSEKYAIFEYLHFQNDFWLFFLDTLWPCGRYLFADFSTSTTPVCLVIAPQAGDSEEKTLPS